MSHYPFEPGWIDGGTSREAAESMRERVPTLRMQCYDHTRAHPGPTADETADVLGETPYAIRPRFSELRAMRLITNIGRGINRSGKPAYRWGVVEDRAISAEEMHRRYMLLPRRRPRTLKQARECYIDFLELLLDQVELGGDNAVAELRAELDVMQTVLDYYYGWI